MSEISSLLNALEAHWKNQLVVPYPGLKDADIDAFEEAQGVRFPDDLRKYFRRFDGYDEFYFRFLRLSEFEHPSAIPRQGDISHYDLSKREFVIVDYMQYCWWYTIDLSDPRGMDTPVLISGTHNNQIIARSFSDFLRLYLDDDVTLYPLPSQEKQ